MPNTPLLNVMTAAAIKAGKGLMRDFGEADQLQISRKGASNFVTSADIRTEKFLRKELNRARPDFGFLMEEAGEIPGKDSAMRWVIDPLDGTNNFIHAIPYFCISIAVEKRLSNGHNEVMAGVIFDPIHNDLFAAEKGIGAYLNDRKISVSRREQMDDAMIATGNLKLAPSNEAARKSLYDASAKEGAIIRYLGATALDMAQVAAGRLDGCWYYAALPWDIAAGIILVQEAGGMVATLDGSPLTVESTTVMATNRMLAEPIGAMVKQKA